MSDGIGEWYKIRRIKEMNEAKIAYEREATRISSHASDDQPQEDIKSSRSPPVLEQLYNVLPPGTQDRIEWRFMTAMIGAILFWIGFGLGKM